MDDIIAKYIIRYTLIQAAKIIMDYKEYSEGMELALDKLSNYDRDSILYSYGTSNTEVIDIMENVLQISPDYSKEINPKYILKMGDELTFRFMFRDTMFFSDDSTNSNGSIVYRVALTVDN